MSFNQPNPEGVCRSCKARLFWADYVRKDGKPGRMPVNQEPTDDGNIQLFRRPDGTIRATFLTRKQAQHMREAAKGLGTELNLRRSHYSTCPAASEWRAP